MINKVANVFGIVFIVFSISATVINYLIYTTLYTSDAPVLFVIMSILNAVLPFLVCTVLSFAVAFLISRTIKSETEKETEVQKDEKIVE